MKGLSVMYKRMLFIFIIINFLISFNIFGMTSEDEINNSLNKITSYWNKGDLQAAMSFYLNSPDTEYISSHRVVGYKNILNNYITRFPNKNMMGHLEFNKVHILALSPSYALVSGRWILNREKKEKMGYFTLLFVNTKLGWKIKVDHSA